MTASLFHPAVEDWFRAGFAMPSPVQAAAWPAIARGDHTLLAAPTGAGKTLAAFLATIDGLLREDLARGLPGHTRVLYVSPLKALSADIQLNLQQPLTGIADRLAAQGLPPVALRAWVRTGDTHQSERARMRRRPPHILITTPESLYILLTSVSGRAMLETVRTVILDEIHALAGSKRGAHLALSLERLEALAGWPLQRIGISATQESVTDMARFLLGTQETGSAGVSPAILGSTDVSPTVCDLFPTTRGSHPAHHRHGLQPAPGSRPGAPRLPPWRPSWQERSGASSTTA